ncbi:hypothetical protein HOLleu_36176 [Holothuria leucospilota]|uniref:Uncharacterized protein n=1 Tax=Holothuria leucospilota TaxID=206669 RepID=A0A9Q1BDH0_HOLLE|nr:hypothetical protein HOLleu_36176 [Holothuria leucospilota]
MTMAQFVSDPTPLQSMQHERFTVKLHAYVLFDLSLSLSGNIAISGQDNRSTFIDLYYGKHSDSRYRFKLFYSKEFQKCTDDLAQRRCVSFLEKDGSKVVTCSGDRIEVIDTKHESRVLKSCRVNGETSCLTVREGEIFVAINGSQTVIVLDHDLRKTKNVTLKAIKYGDCPYDLQVVKDTTYVCTIKHLALADSDYGIVTDYRDTTGKYRQAFSITVSEKLGLIAVLWGGIVRGGNRIIVYTLTENKSLLVVDVESAVARIRFSGRDRMMITGNEKTGEVKLYDLSHLFTYEHLKEHLVSELRNKDCRKLALDLCPASKASILKSISPALALLRVLEREAIIKETDMDTLADALVKINLSCHSIVDIYQKIRPGYKPKQTYAELKEDMKEKEGAWDDQRKQLRKELEDLKMHSAAKIQALERKLETEVTESTKKMSAIMEQLEQTKLEPDQTQEQNVNFIRGIDRPNQKRTVS